MALYDFYVGAVKRGLVLEAVNELGYRPNAIARSMVKQKTATVGLILTEVDNPLFVPVIAGISAGLLARRAGSVLPGPPVVVPVAALDLVSGGCRPPQEPLGKGDGGHGRAG